MSRVEKEMSFLDHLEELRWHLVRSAIAVVVFTIAAFISVDFVFNQIIFAPSRPDFWTFRTICSLAQMIGAETFCIDEIPFKLQSRQMTGQFMMHISSSFVIGIIAAFPYMFWEIWRFIKPGLHSTERSFSRGAVFFVSLLFMLGVMFGYYVMSPIAIYFLSNYQISDAISNEFDITSYVSTISTLVLGSGALFQLPMVVYFLSKIGLLTPSWMRQYRRHAIVVILILAAMLTPPDPLSQMLIAGPLLLLYEISIIISGRVLKERLKRQAEANSTTTL
ncbi:MAG TPA: twin-arginine translocase subunit TatC [Cyclobacteriaceae bacterium]|nr:twin-arginine translocase subunit TatC [Cyclobacteriaceae bacterium]